MSSELSCFHEEAEKLKQNKHFDAAKDKYQEAIESYAGTSQHAVIVDCFIQQQLCILELEMLEEMVQETQLEEPPNIRRILDKAEKEIKNLITEKFGPSERLQDKSLRKFYTKAENLFDEYGFSFGATESFYRAKEYERKIVKKPSPWQWRTLTALKILTRRYTEGEWWILVIFLVSMLSFGLIYCVINALDANCFEEDDINNPLDCFYFSVVVLTTLGFGDISPSCWYGKLFVMFEVIWGFILIGVLIAVFTSKLGRR